MRAERAHLKLVLFDLDGVLVHYDHDRRLRVLAERSGCDVGRVGEALFGSGLEARADRGEIDAAEQVDVLARDLGAPLTQADCIAARAASMTADTAVIALAGRVARHADVAILTNNGLMLRDHLDTICPPLRPLFAGRVFCSAQFGVQKPDSAIFMCCVARLDALPVHSLFIDDKVENAAGARAAGLHAHHFRGHDALEAELANMGLLESNDHAP